MSTNLYDFMYFYMILYIFKIISIFNEKKEGEQEVKGIR